MGAVPDQNDQLQAGTLKANPRAGATPINKAAEEKAKREAADAPRILTVRQILEASARRSKAEDRNLACTTGHWMLDDATGGIRPSKSLLFGADTSWGKSSWLVAVTDENLRQGKRVLIVTSEDDEETYGDRLLARRSRVRARTIRSGSYTEDDEREIEHTLKHAEDLPVFLDARGRSCEWTARKVDALIESEGIDLVAYDYVQEWHADKEQEAHRLTVKYIGGVLRKVVKLRKKASALFSQLTIPDDAKGGAFPSRKMIRDCKDLANAAELIFIGYSPTKAVTDGDSPGAPVIVPAGERAIFVDKNKSGPRGFAVWAEWDTDTASFNAVPKPPTTPAKQTSFYDQVGGR